jgi:hypothetical protein
MNFITGGYCINPTGTFPTGTDWGSYWDSLKVYDKWDCFSRSSADSDSPLWERFKTVYGDVELFRAAVESQQMHPISMGVYQFSRYAIDETTNALYLVVPQTGAAVFFKLHAC